MTAPITVTNRRGPTPFLDPFAAYLALRAEYGARDVALLESLAGPDEDRRSAVITLGPLAELTVTRGVLRIAGPEHFRAAVTRTGAAAGLLHRDGDDWRLTRDRDALQVSVACTGALVAAALVALGGSSVVPPLGSDVLAALAVGVVCGRVLVRP